MQKELDGRMNLVALGVNATAMLDGSRTLQLDEEMRVQGLQPDGFTCWLEVVEALLLSSGSHCRYFSPR